jgi:hypothetical protein
MFSLNKRVMKKTGILFLIIFVILGLLTFQVPISQIIGSNQNFTLFELIAPQGGMFLGPLFGAIAAFIVRVLNIAITHQSLDFLTIIRFLPMVLAAIYFGTRDRRMGLIFPICIALFLIHPIGRQAAAYTLLWLIPFAATFRKERLILNSLGATFTAHAVGSTIFLYAFGLTPQMWLALIPQVLLERGFFALGIWASYLLINTVLDRLTSIQAIRIFKPLVNKNYSFSVKFFKSYA